MNASAEYFDSNNKYINLLVHEKEILKDTVQCGINLIVIFE